ncbi:MAG TPA: hypothetical protein VKT00_13150, partial [Casimicrobiaceae bacterium]|nr:hypothetical protein [Casimicrobiaceae bacterium]
GICSVGNGRGRAQAPEVRERRPAGPGAASLEDIPNPTRETGSLAAPPAYDDCAAGALGEMPSPRADAEQLK